MFVGAVPKTVITQLMTSVRFADWGKVFVGCSGSFRCDAAIKACFPDVQVFSNDVSLFSVALGRLLTGEVFDLTFTNRLAFVEQQLEGGQFIDRVAAVMVANEMAKYAGKNDYAKAHFAHYERGFEGFQAKARARLVTFAETTKIDGFHAGDFRDQVVRARNCQRRSK